MADRLEGASVAIQSSRGGSGRRFEANESAPPGLFHRSYVRFLPLLHRVRLPISALAYVKLVRGVRQFYFRGHKNTDSPQRMALVLSPWGMCECGQFERANTDKASF